jgi:hypothetical protein
VVACAGSWPRGRCSFAVSLYPGTAIPHTPKIRRSYTRKLYGNLTSGGQSPWQSPGAYVVRPRIPEIRVTVDPRPAGPVARAGRRSRIATNIFQVANSSYCFTPRSNMQSSFLCKVPRLRPSTVLCCGAGPCRSRWVQPRPDPARLVSPLYSSAPHEPARRPSHASLLGAHRAHPRSRRVKEL